MLSPVLSCVVMESSVVRDARGGMAGSTAASAAALPGVAAAAAAMVGIGYCRASARAWRLGELWGAAGQVAAGAAVRISTVSDSRTART